MFIDTHSQTTMEKSITEYLSISKEELYTLIENASYRASENSTWFDGNIFNNIVNDFIQEHISDKEIDEILFFHLGRRLNNASEINEGNNLYELLTTENSFSDFLLQHNIVFKTNDGHLDLYYKEKKKSLENTMGEHIPYLRSRLGYNSGREDYCFNGFAFKDLLYKNSYARELAYAPEFLGVLAQFLKNDKILMGYYENSAYYCYEYLIPIDFVMFDNDENMDLSEKKIYIVNQVIQRLHDYYFGNPKYMSDNENPILRLCDYCTMDAQYFIQKELITPEMIR